MECVHDGAGPYGFLFRWSSQPWAKKDNRVVDFQEKEANTA
jgi:hypothetical protein